jgi:uncharacterized membrane protein YoaK (UPF0700 family)
MLNLVAARSGVRRDLATARMPRWVDRPAFLVTLTAVAGWVDALCFLMLGKVFTSFMSGNWLFLGIGAGTGDAGLVVRAGAAMAAFALGCAFGARHIGGRLSPIGSGAAVRRGLLLEATLLAGFAAVWLVSGDAAPQSALRVGLLGLAAGAMGIQAALSLALEVPMVATVALTAGFAQFARAAGLGTLRAQARGEDRPGAALLLGLCVSYLLTALAVALLPRTATLALVPLPLLALAARAAR